MARVNEADPIELSETGGEPEYFISGLLKHEVMENGMIRLYFGARRRNVARVEYTVICSTTDLVMMARECLNIVGDAHNDHTFKGMIGRAN